MPYRNIAENLNRLSRAYELYRQTTDRQTDGRQHIANVNAKNYVKFGRVVPEISMHANRQTHVHTDMDDWHATLITILRFHTGAD